MRTRIRAVVVCCFGMGLAVDAQAQAEAEAEEVVFEEIIVTAQKRQENLQDVPIAISVVKSEALRELNINNPTELENYIPSLKYGDSVHPRGEGYSIRGVGTQSFSEASESSVSTVIDGVIVGQFGAMGFDFADLDQVEVLRGPQGTLFGKNATAGVINILTNRPDLSDHSATVRLTGSTRDGSHGRNAEYTNLEAVGNLALTDTFGLRLVAARADQDGWVQNYFNDKDVQGYDNTSAALKALWAPSDDLEVYATVTYAESDTDCCTWTTRTPDPAGLLITAQAPVVADDENEEVIQDEPSFYDMDLAGASVEVNYDLGNNLGNMVLTSITGYRDWSIKLNLDTDHRPFDAFNRNFGDTTQDQFSQELRLASPTGERLEWTAGLYYYTQEIDSFTRQVFVIPGVLSLGRDAGPDFETTSSAVFAELKYSATEAFKLIAGARYTWEDLEGTFTRTQTPGTTLPFPDAEFYSYETDGDEPSWRLGALYEIDAGMVYATVSKGFKGPTVNVLADYVLSDPRGIYVDPEFALSYELGLKATWMDGRLTTNIAVFDTEFEDFQAQTYDATTTFPGQFRLTNAGALSTQGLELDLTVRWDYLSVMAAVSYIEAEFDDFGAPCYVGQTAAQGCLPIPGAGGITQFDASGSGIPGSPDWSYAVTAAYDRPINDRYHWHLIGNYYWQDDVSFSAAANPNLELDAYGLFNLNAGISRADGKWTASLFAKNLFDENYVNSLVSTAFFAGSYSQFPAWGSHREYGLMLEANF